MSHALVAILVAALALLAPPRRQRSGVDFRTLYERSAAEIADLQERYEHALWRAGHDSLTGLPNRAALFEYVADEDAGLRPSKRPTAALLIDVDDFKQYNDRLGHPVGDQLIKEIGQRLLELRKLGHYAARLGGDEFVVLAICPAREDSAFLYEAAFYVKSLFDEPFTVEIQSEDGLFIKFHLSVNVSIGATPVRSVEEFDDVLGDADKTLFKVKENGKSGLCWYFDEPGRAPDYQARGGEHSKIRAEDRRRPTAVGRAKVEAPIPV